MTDNKSRIENLIWNEVALKSKSASIGFGIIAILLSINYFSLEKFQIFLRTICILIVFTNIFRFIIAKKIVRTNHADKKTTLYLKITIWANALLFCLLYLPGEVYLPYSDVNYAIIMILAIGFAAAATVTLGYANSIFIPFQLAMLLPLILTSLYRYFSEGSSPALTLAIIFTIDLAYQLKQYKDYRDQVIQRFKYEIELEDALEGIKRSKETLIEQTAKVVRSSRLNALVDMASGLSHEVNNSLQVILGDNEQIKRELVKSNQLSDVLASKIERSTAAIQKIRGTVEGLMYFSMQKKPDNKAVVEVKEIIERTHNYTNEMLKAHHIKLFISPIPDVSVMAHSIQITEILFALIKNAEDALFNKKPEDQWIRLDFSLEKSWVFIKVINGGKKITTEDQKRIFQPFFSTKDVNQGTGMSLSISRGIALEHKGNLYLDAEAENTTFILQLPLKD